MATRLQQFWHFLAQHKYAVTILLFLTWMTFIDDNNFLLNYRRNREEASLREKIDDYKQQYETYSRQVQELETNPAAIEKKAREQYYMQRVDEDVFVVVDNNDMRASQP